MEDLKQPEQKEKNSFRANYPWGNGFPQLKMLHLAFLKAGWPTFETMKLHI